MMNMVSVQPRDQRGATLIIALIILVVMTMIGITSMQSSTLQERMSANVRQKTISRSAAETALRVAEDWLDTTVKNAAAFNDYSGTDDSRFSAVPRPGGLAAEPLQVDLTDKASWAGVGMEISSGDLDGVEIALSSDMVSSQPKLVIEYVGRDLKGTANKTVLTLDAEAQGDGDTSPYFFRITAIGWGRDPNIYTVLESNYRTGYGTDSSGNTIFTY